MMVTLFVSVFSYAQNPFSSQNINFRIVTKDHREYTGVMDYFRLRSDVKKIKIPTANGEITLLSDDLTDIYLWMPSSTDTMRLSHLPTRTYPTKKRFSNHKAIWLSLAESSPKLDLYNWGQLYTIKKSTLITSSYGEAGQVSIYYYFRKPKDEYAVMMGQDVGGSISLGRNVLLRRMAEDYFSDCCFGRADRK